MKDPTLAALCAALVVLLSGCATSHKYNVAPWPWTAKANASGKSTIEPVCATDKCSPGEARIAYLQATEFCRRMQDYYAAGGMYAQSGKMALSTIGAVAGSVIAPIASGTAATAWSGVSGVTNGLQTQVNEAFSEAVDIQRRASIATAARNGDTAFRKDAETDDERVYAAIAMARECAMGPAEADRSTMRALVDPITD